MPPTFHDVQLSGVVQGVSATAKDGVYIYRLFVHADALREVGATDDTASWLAAFHRNESLIAACAAELHRASPNSTAIIETFATR